VQSKCGPEREEVLGGNNSQKYDDCLFLVIYLKGNKEKSIAEGLEIQNVPISMA